MACISNSSFSVCINGEIKGFFKGGRGLRQGDPISPYLFTLVMEVFNLIMKKKIQETQWFKYHYKCKQMALTHICFADDLFVLCHGDDQSVLVVKQVLDEFGKVLGLLPNLNKGTIFFGSVPGDIQHKILQVLPFTVGYHPMKYLGVPLLSKRLSKNDCRGLIDKVKDKVGNWKNKKLSYAGRLQLVASVLAPMQVYWMSAYILPCGVIEEIERLLKGFLWCQSDSAKGKAKVAWYDVCFPKDQGGLGLKNLREWNESLVVKNLWRIITQKDSLWGKWVNIVKLKGKSIWDIQCREGDSWGWKFLMNLRDKVKPHVCLINVNGREDYVWVNNAGKKVNSPQIKSDSINHLFFLCEYSGAVWKIFRDKLLFRGLPNQFSGILQCLAKYPYSNNIWNIMNRIVFAACVYFVWQERNYRIFKYRRRSIDNLVQVIQDYIRLKLVSLKIVFSGSFIWACCFLLGLGYIRPFQMLNLGPVCNCGDAFGDIAANSRRNSFWRLIFPSKLVPASSCFPQLYIAAIDAPQKA
ncbi:uncharacterized protein [Rutidosis leptorrhynchoides]|uniref:uncharacterized protein n=1 Tax=Rutidosis leptorrhynchoides TaxID=125765 RepID=UPI003A993B71